MKAKFLLLLILLICSGISNAQIGEDDFTCTTQQVPLESIGELINTTWTLKVLLVEFSDVKHRNPVDHGKPAYTFDDWNDLFFSEGIYVSPNMYCPDGKRVYGSMRDYFKIISDGNFSLTGYIVNRDDNNDGIPDWLSLPDTKQEYNNYQAQESFMTAVNNAAAAAGLDISTPSNTKLAIIYAGQTYRDRKGLNPYATGVGGSRYIMGERLNRFAPDNQEDPDAVFCGIGIHAHEFGHCIGWYDAYGNLWGLMNGGNVLPLNSSINDIEKTASAPLPPSPYERWLKGWVSYTTISSDQRFDADYNLKDPEIFKIVDSSDPTRYFLIECRHAHGTMTIGQTVTHDYNHFAPWNLWGTRTGLQDVWVMVWAVKKNTSLTNYARLIQADGFNNNSTNDNMNMLFGYLSNTYWGDSGDIFPGLYDVRVLSPWSFPQNLEGRHTPSAYPATNIGFEIVSVQNDYITVDFYTNNPEDASPAQPRFLSAANITDAIQLTWAANSEPDLAGYEVYRKINSGSVQKISGSNLVTGTSYVDNGLQIVGNSLTEHTYYVKAVDTDSKKSTYSIPVSVDVEAVSQGGAKRSAGEDISQLPKHFELAQNYPNPFNPTTTIAFALPQDSPVRLTIFDINGRQVAELLDKPLGAGRYETPFDASQLASGVYFYQLTAGSFTQTRKMMLMQ